MNSENRFVSWTRVTILCGIAIAIFLAVVFVYYFINIWLPAQEIKKSDLRIQEIEELLKVNL